MAKLWIVFGTIVVGLFAILINIATNKENNIIDANFPPPINPTPPPPIKSR